MYGTASCPPLRDGIESTSKSIPEMPLHSLPSLANPREARVSRASSPYRFARTWAQHPCVQGDPSSSVLRDLAATRATRGERCALNWRLSGTPPPGMSVPRSSREERGRLDWSQTDGRGRREKLRRVLGYQSRLGDRILEDVVESANMLRHLGRDATQVIDQVRRPEAREARERAEPSAHRLSSCYTGPIEPNVWVSAEVAESRDEQVDAGGSGHDHDQDLSMVGHPAVELLGQ